MEFAAERHAQTFAHEEQAVVEVKFQIQFERQRGCRRGFDFAHDNHVVIERGGAAFLEAEASHIGFQAAGQRDAAAVVADVGCARQGEAAAGLV